MFDRLFLWLSRKLLEVSSKPCEARIPTRIGRDDSVIDGDSTVHMKLHYATGGAVLEFNHYDNVRDRVKRELYIIPDGDDMTTTIANSIFQMHLKK